MINHVSLENFRKSLTVLQLEDKFKILNIEECTIMSQDNSIIFEDDFIDLKDIETVLPRVDVYSFKLESFFEFFRRSLDIKIFNEGISVTNDKFLSYLRCERNGIDCIPTTNISSKTLSYPLSKSVLKTTTGYSGLEVFLVENEKEAKEILKKFSDKELILQPFIETDNSDYRVVVAQGEVIDFFKRVAPKGSFKANTSQGGSRIEMEIPAELKEIALKTAKALNVDFIGLDFLKDKERYLFCEANNSFRIRNEKVASDIIKKITRKD